MSVTAIVATPSSREVREWAVAQGLAVPGRGRLSTDAVAAFNRAHGLWGVRAYRQDEPVRRHSVKPVKGRTVTRNYRVSDARAWAVEHGFSRAGQRGRMSREVLDAFVLSVTA